MHRFVSESSIRLDIFLKLQFCDFSRSYLQRVIETSKVFVNNNIIIKPSFKLSEGDVVEVKHYFSLIKEDTNLHPLSGVIDAVYEDEYILVVNKPAGLVVHPGVGHRQDTLVNILLSHCGDDILTAGEKNRPGIVHRLDKDTSGLMIIAKTDFAHYKLSEQIMQKNVVRKYNALVWGVVKRSEFTIDHNLVKSRGDHRRMKVVLSKDIGKSAITHIKLLRHLSDYASLVECALETGRTHQIRAHMSYVGHSIIGDQLYGKNEKKILDYVSDGYKDVFLNFTRQALHSCYIKFMHPIENRTIEFSSSLPEDIKRIIDIF